MKKILCILMLLLITGCNKDDIDYKLEIREHYETIESFDADFEITTNISDKSQIFNVNYSYTKDDVDIITINSPESISGVSLRLKNSETPELLFENIMLYTFIEENLGISPSDILSFAVSDLKNKEPSYISVSDVMKFTYEDEKILKDIYLNTENYDIISVEAYVDGMLISKASLV